MRAHEGQILEYLWHRLNTNPEGLSREEFHQFDHAFVQHHHHTLNLDRVVDLTSKNIKLVGKIVKYTKLA